MEARLSVTGSASTIYQTLLELFQKEYQTATGQTIQLEAIQEGLTYIKHFGKQGEQSVRLPVGELIPDKQYTVAVLSNRGRQWLTYQLQPLEDGRTEVTYTEDYLPEGKFQEWNYRLLLPLMRKGLEKRMTLQIEKLAEFAEKKEVS